MKQSTYIQVDDKKIAVVRNPYERIVTLYRESWDWVGLETWLQRQHIQSQTELYTNELCITLEHWESDCKDLDISPDKKSMELLTKKYSMDYKRWYGTRLLDIATPIVERDLVTFGYRF